jgi:hypothetical protein
LTRKLLIALLPALLLPVGSADAATPSKTRGLLGISPPRRVVVARPPVSLRPT